MKHTALLALVALLIVSSASHAQNRPAASASGTFTVDTRTSNVQWVGKKVLGQHNGTISLASGSLTVANNAITAGSFDIDMKTIKVLDIKDAETNAKLVGHLQSDDFFSVAKHPKATFVITSVEPLTSRVAGATHTVKGNLTIKGITHEISFPARIIIAGRLLSATTSFNINRTKWDIKYGSGSFFDNLGDKAINDEFSIELNLKANL